ncbi:MAG TPA: DUF6624 domain-containing protein [Croceibacterium sp.]
MIRRCLALSLCALVLCAADAPPPPAALEPYIKDGRLDPGDYGWIKGRFQDATSEEAAAFRAIIDWSTACRESALTELRAELATKGFATAAVENVFPGPLLCSQVASQPMVADITSFAAFQQELAAPRVVADTYLAAVRLAEDDTRPGAGADLRRQLEARPLGEQLLRHAFTWGRGLEPDSPNLTPAGRAIFQARISVAAVARDRANTEWLKGVVAEHGWPRISQVGEHASNQAWLLVQHADHDPVFQLDALRLMEPMIAEGEVSKQNYAYLYDRIMLKLAGKQRYATQVRCQDDVRSPLPLEDEATVDQSRAAMGLPPVKEYIDQFNRSIPCAGLPENTIRSQGGSSGNTAGGSGTG